MSEDIRAAMATRDLMSATLALSELSAEELRQEADDIELAHARLARLLQRIYRKAA